jgi:undecaprenyl pyrophosphate phosphatase UppP
MKIFDQLTALIFPDTLEITKETIDYYEQNPDELDLIINKEHFHSAYLGLFFIMGLVLTIAARVIAFVFGSKFGDFINEIILDVISELGIAIFGGAVVAYLIEFLNKKQYQQNVKFRMEVKQMIALRKQNKS